MNVVAQMLETLPTTELLLQAGNHGLVIQGNAIAAAQSRALAAKCFLFAGDRKRAVDIATAIPDMTYRLDAYNAILRAHLKQTNPKFAALLRQEEAETKAAEE
jgi:hypothetical protein